MKEKVVSHTQQKQTKNQTIGRISRRRCRRCCCSSRCSTTGSDGTRNQTFDPRTIANINLIVANLALNNNEHQSIDRIPEDRCEEVDRWAVCVRVAAMQPRRPTQSLICTSIYRYIHFIDIDTRQRYLASVQSCAVRQRTLHRAPFVVCFDRFEKLEFDLKLNSNWKPATAATCCKQTVADESIS